MTKNERHAIQLSRNMMQMIRSMYDVMPSVLSKLMFIKTLISSLLLDYAQRRLSCKKKKEFPTVQDFATEVKLYLQRTKQIEEEKSDTEISVGLITTLRNICIVYEDSIKTHSNPIDDAKRMYDIACGALRR
jgi:hypothetical protein